MALDGIRIEDGSPPPDNAELARLPRNDSGNAARLIARHGHEMAWVPEIGWHVWDGRRWASENGNEAAYRRAMATAEAIYDEADELPGEEPGTPPGPDGKKRGSPRGAHRKFALSTGNAGKLNAMLQVAEPQLLATQANFDAAKLLVNVQNGTLDLEGGVRILPHDATQRLTRLCNVAYDPSADCPNWRAFIKTVLADDATAVFVQVWLGYCLTGDISEQCFVMFDGKGSNGKSTLLETVARIIGDYAGNAPIETFLHNENRTGSGPSPDIARLPRVRLIRTSEPEQGARLSESRIKQWTGGEQLTARKLQRDFFDFTPAGKITMSVNVKPAIVGKDDGTKTRILVVPFKHRFERRGTGRKRDYVAEFVAHEGPGILNWLLDGYRIWAEDGLKVPSDVRLATDDMFTEQDPIGVAIAEILIETGNPDHAVPAQRFMDVYNEWSRRRAEVPKSQTAVGRRMAQKGFRKRNIKNLTHYTGVKFHEDWEHVV